MGETLEEGLNALFGAGAATPQRVATQDSLSIAGSGPAVVGGGVPAAPPAASGAISGLAQQAQAHYDRAIAAQRAGNWAEYGREIEALGAALRALRAGKQ